MKLAIRVQLLAIEANWEDVREAVGTVIEHDTLDFESSEVATAVYGRVKRPLQEAYEREDHMLEAPRRPGPRGRAA